MIDVATGFESFLKVLFSHILVIPFEKAPPRPALATNPRARFGFVGMKNAGASAPSSIHGKKIAKVRNAVVRIVTILREKKRAGRPRTSAVLPKYHM
jgi:hypothetical protein